MVLVQKWPFFDLLFLGKIGHENVFYDILERKNVSLGYKKKTFKKSPIDFFPKGLTHGFLQKWPFFQLFFQAIQAKKMSLTIISKEKTPFQAIKTRSSKSRNIDIFAKGLTHGFGGKMANFPTFFFQAIQATKMFYDILERKSPFQTIKTRSCKSRKIHIFSKGLTHGFGPKMADFPAFFLAIQARKMSFTIFQNEKRLSRL